MSLQPKQFQQLQMFMKPSEMAALPGFDFGDRFSEQSVDDLRHEKLTEADDAQGTTWYGRLRSEDGAGSFTEQLRGGVREPVSVYHGYGRMGTPILDEGHHRYFVAERRERQGDEVYLPVRHAEWDD